MLVHVTDIETGRVRDPGGRLLAVNDCRSWQEAAFGADLDPVRTCGCGPLYRGRGDGWVSLRCCQFERIQCNLGQAITLGRVGNVPLEVEEAVIGSVQDAEAIRLRFQCYLRVCHTIYDWRVIELFHTDGDVRGAGDLLGFAEWIGLILPGSRIVEVTVRIVVWIVDRSVHGICSGGPEPGTVHPASVGTHA